MTVQATSPLDAFQWTPQPAPFQFLRECCDAFLSACPTAAALAQRMTDQTGTRFIDWIDHVVIPRLDPRADRLHEVGYSVDGAGPHYTIYRNEAGMFPPVLVGDLPFELVLKAESVADFAAVHGIQHEIHGQPLGSYRYVAACDCKPAHLWVAERHGYRGFALPKFDATLAIARVRHLEALRRRRRDFDDDADGFEHAAGLIDAAIADLGMDLTCDIWFAAEREYWQRRNHAARVQKARQDRLGLGWANHDHHTYRSSRRNFKHLVAMWEKLGFHCRERFYAGREAGWGAQVMEQPTTGIITFNDVDLTPDELMGDFSHDGLEEQGTLGTVGLWCGLHGDSFLQAGMHHLEAQFDFESLRKQLEEEGSVKTMKPFTDFPYLRQAFTEGERWKVDPVRIQKLLDAQLITDQQATQFREQGAIGSHLENLERNDGFKGFNQTGVSEIISATDPRKQVRN